MIPFDGYKLTGGILFLSCYVSLRCYRIAEFHMVKGTTNIPVPTCSSRAVFVCVANMLLDVSSHPGISTESVSCLMSLAMSGGGAFGASYGCCTRAECS